MTSQWYPLCQYLPSPLPLPPSPSPGVTRLPIATSSYRMLPYANQPMTPVKAI